MQRTRGQAAEKGEQPGVLEWIGGRPDKSLLTLVLPHPCLCMPVLLWHCAWPKAPLVQLQATYASKLHFLSLQGHSCQVTSMSCPYTSGGCLPALWVCSTRVMAREMLCFRA